jgi:hypothetical protein
MRVLPPTLSTSIHSHKRTGLSRGPAESLPQFLWRIVIKLPPVSYAYVHSHPPVLIFMRALGRLTATRGNVQSILMQLLFSFDWAQLAVVGHCCKPSWARLSVS